MEFHTLNRQNKTIDTFTKACQKLQKIKQSEENKSSKDILQTAELYFSSSWPIKRASKSTPADGDRNATESEHFKL